MVTLTVYLANVGPAEAAAHFYRAGLSGTAHAHVGFAPPYGIEQGTTITFGGLARIDRALQIVRDYLRERGETSAWVEAPNIAGFDGGALVYASKPDPAAQAAQLRSWGVPKA